MNVRFILGGLTIASAAAITFTGCNKSNDDAVSTTVGEEIAEELFTQPLQSVKDPSMVLAVVNGTEITQGQINTEVERMLQRMQGRVPPERVEQMRAQMETQMLDNLVNRQVLLDKVASENITISDEEFDTAVGELTANLPPGASLDDMLAQTGTSQDEFRDNFGMELKIRKLIEASSGGTIEATEEEALAFYEENKQQFEKPESATASHILISVDAGSSDEDKAAKRAELEAIRMQLLEGADFAELAGEHSSCPSKAQGGNLGEFTRGRMVPEFEQAAFSQPIGEVGEIVETQFGFHLVKVTDRSEGGVTPYDEVKDQLSRYLSGQKQQEVARDYIEGLVESAEISYPGRE